MCKWCHAVKQVVKGVRRNFPIGAEHGPRLLHLGSRERRRPFRLRSREALRGLRCGFGRPNNRKCIALYRLRDLRWVRAVVVEQESAPDKNVLSNHAPGARAAQWLRKDRRAAGAPDLARTILLRKRAAAARRARDLEPAYPRSRTALSNSNRASMGPTSSRICSNR